jgi:hypothetical protein
MASASPDLCRRSLCGRANAERVAIRMSSTTGKIQAMVRAGSTPQPFCVTQWERTLPVQPSCKLRSRNAYRCEPSGGLNAAINDAI